MTNKDRIRDILKSGAKSTSELAAMLNVSYECMRRHMINLLAEGEVFGERESAQVGRPGMRWTLAGKQAPVERLRWTDNRLLGHIR